MAEAKEWKPEDRAMWAGGAWEVVSIDAGEGTCVLRHLQDYGEHGDHGEASVRAGVPLSELRPVD